MWVVEESFGVRLSTYIIMSRALELVKTKQFILSRMLIRRSAELIRGCVWVVGE
jgi:hypothetical protein